MLVSDEELKQFDNTVGIERLKSFAIHNKNINTFNDLKEYYIANIMISQAFYSILSTIEITLRNAIDTTFKNVFGNDWLEKTYKQNDFLDKKAYEIFEASYEKIKNKYKDKFTPGKVIAELHYGFWTNLCSKKYNTKIWTKKGCFKSVFINYPNDKQQQIHDISIKLDKIRKFRNRIFHYEPIIRDDYDIACMYMLIEEVLSYLPKDNLDIVQASSEFKKVYKQLDDRFKSKKPRALYDKS